MQLGLRGKPGDLRVDCDDLHAALHEVDDPVTIEALEVGLQRVVAPDEHDLRHLVIRVIVALGELLRAVGNPRCAGGGDHARDTGQIARLAGEEARVVRGTERPAQTRDVRGDVAAGALGEDDGLGAVLLLHVHELLGDEIVRPIPADALPHVFAAVFRIALHGVEQAFLMVGDLGRVQATHAQTTVGPRILRVAFALHEVAVVVGVHDHAAAHMAARARPCATTRDVEIALLVLERLLMIDGSVCSPMSTSSSRIARRRRRAPSHLVCKFQAFAERRNGAAANSPGILACVLADSILDSARHAKHRRSAWFAEARVGFKEDVGGESSLWKKYEHCC